MEYLKTYNEYNNMLVLEKLDIKKMLKEFKESKNRKIAKSIIISLLSIYSFTQVKSYIKKQNLEKEKKEILLSELKIKSDSLLSKNKQLSKSVENLFKKYKDPTKMIFSQKGWDQLRIEEGSIEHKGEPVLKSYKIGDGMITIGYGHAEKISKSKYKISDTITKKEANDIFIKDVNKVASGVKRMFKEWKKENINVRLTQNQYDVCISLAFNKGISGFRKSSFVKKLKEGDILAAAKEIKNEKSKYKGVKARRYREYKKFLM